MPSVLSLSDVAFAALMSFFVLILINAVMRLVNLFFKPIEIEHTKIDIRSVIEKCQNLFPTEKIKFGGEIFQRGMKLRIITTKQKIIEGQFIGSNKDDVICVLTSRYIVAQDLKNIKEIKQIVS